MIQLKNKSGPGPRSRFIHSIVILILSTFLSQCSSIVPIGDIKEFRVPTKTLTMPSLSIQFQVPRDWKVEYVDNAIETEDPDLFPSMRLAPAPGSCSSRHISALKQELSGMIQRWDPVQSRTINGLSGFSWEGSGHREGLEYTLFLLLLENRGGCLVTVVFIPDDIDIESRIQVEPIIQSIRPM